MRWQRRWEERKHWRNYKLCVCNLYRWYDCEEERRRDAQRKGSTIERKIDVKDLALCVDVEERLKELQTLSLCDLYRWYAHDEETSVEHMPIVKGGAELGAKKVPMKGKPVGWNSARCCLCCCE